VTVVCTPPSGSLFPAGTNTVACYAVDGCGNFNSCSFLVTIIPPSRLSIALTHTNTVLVSWPSPSTGWNLQQNNDLSTANWVTPAETVNNNGTINYIIVNPPAGNRFYRLVQ
jgi:hypothetical protein